MVRCEDRARRGDRDDVEGQYWSHCCCLCGRRRGFGGGDWSDRLGRSQEAEAARCDGGGCGEGRGRELFGGLFGIFVF